MCAIEEIKMFRRQIKSQSGTLIVEMAIVAPFVFLICLTIAQVFTVFFSAIENANSASVAVKMRLNSWQNENAANGRVRPCIELITPNFETRNLRSSALGVGRWAKQISSPQTLYITYEDICSHN